MTKITPVQHRPTGALVSFLRLSNPSLFERLERTRHLDGRLVEVFDDLETIARMLDHADAGTASRMTGVVDELIEELRLRIESCEALLEKTRGEKS